MANEMRDRLVELINQVRGNEIALADYEADTLVDHLRRSRAEVKGKEGWYKCVKYCLGVKA